MSVTDREYQEMRQNVEFCKVHRDTEIETGTVVEYCPKCENQNKMIPLTEKEIAEKGEMWYD